MRPSRSARLAVIVLVVVSTTACVRKGDAEVQVRTLDADLVFGVTPPNQAPPNFGPPEFVAGSDGASTDVDVNTLEDGFATFKPRPRLGTTQVACPPAALNEFPEREAGQRADAFPAVGIYRWKRGGSIAYSVAPDRPVPYAGFEERTLRNLTVIKDQPDAPPGPQGTQTGGGGKEFTFDTEQPDTTGSQTTTSSWRVRTDTVSVTPGALTFNGPNQGDPGRGLTLTAMVTRDKSGETLADYSFPTGVLYLPMPTRAGLAWQSAAVDPKSGATVNMDAHVVDHQFVDACGEIVDGWRVESTQTFSGQAGNLTQQYNYVVAPQLGAVLVSEQRIFDVAGQVGGHFDLSFTMGQLKPDPLPAEDG